MRAIQQPVRWTYFLVISGAWLLATNSPALSLGDDQATALLRGRWQAIELVDDGRVIPPEIIPTWIPTGGPVEVIDNTIVFTSSVDGQRHARSFEVDATRYPCEINFRADGRLYAHGIYQLDQGRLVICAIHIDRGPRPTDFSAQAGSRRVLLVLKHPADTAPPAGGQPPAGTARVLPPVVDVSKALTAATSGKQAAVPAPTEVIKLPPPPDLRSLPGTTGKLLTDAEVQQLILGTWKYKDAYGDYFLTLDKTGTFNTYRETATTSAFQQVFVRAPVSSGSWTLTNGQLTFRCTSSVEQDRVNQQHPFAVRSVSENDMIFTDARGQVIKGVKIR
jgi:uncharacterized protein (TIGR03067 family)